MEKTIESALKYLKDFDSYSHYQEAIIEVSAYIEQFQADYDARLKADITTILEDLRLNIENLNRPDCEYAVNGCLYWGDIDKVIEQKINSLNNK